MNIEAKVELDQLQRVLEELGATVSWPEGAPIGKSIVLDADVDNHSAYECLPSSFFERDEEARDLADERDVRDFVAALACGDRFQASALVTRLWTNPRNQFAFERGIAGALAS